MKTVGVALLAAWVVAAPSAAGPVVGQPWALGPFTKRVRPILGPSPDAVFACPMLGRQVRWEALAAYNAAAVVRDGRVFLLYRAQDPDGVSRLGLASSRDGLTFTRRPAPVLHPDDDAMKEYEWPGGCEDPRLVSDGKGGYVLTYTAWDKRTARVAVATSPDLVRWTKRGLAFGGKHRNLWSKSGSIVCRWKGSECVAVKVHGHYWMLWGDTSIFAATSDDLLSWTPLESDATLSAVLTPRGGSFDSELVEPGPPAFLTREGILCVYNGRNLAGEAGDPRLSAGGYATGQALFAPDDPMRLLARAAESILRPELDSEMQGQVPNVVFGEGLVMFKGHWLLYYGTADSRLAVASAPIR
ncbi:MAG: glycoside hydrolase family 130 protein [Vicinamibacteria bacterium]